MTWQRRLLPGSAALLILLAATPVGARGPDLGIRPRPAGASSEPAYCHTAHNVGKIALGVNNDGTLGLGSGEIDCFTGQPLPDCEYPIRSRHRYLWGAGLWLGAVVGPDTLVSTGLDGWGVAGREFHPEADPHQSMTYRSTVDHDPRVHEGAVSEQDFIATYYDTCTNCPGVSSDPVDGRPHIPLGVEVVQESYAWSQPYAEDFVLFRYAIKNLTEHQLSDMFFGLWLDADVTHLDRLWYEGAIDDITGFLEATAYSPLPTGCLVEDTLHLAWIADNDSDFSLPDSMEVPHVTAVSFVQVPTSATRLSYNWWISSLNSDYDFGPQARMTYRDFATGGSGTPIGDRDKYHLLSNGEIDYNQVYLGIIPVNDVIWVPPPDRVRVMANGMDTKFLLSVGPFSIEPGGEVPLSLAYLIGENLHRDSMNLENLPENPDTYLGNLDFSDLLTNAFTARSIYDNPGIDTDGDGYAGEFRLCEDDTVWYRGDGVPDWQVSVAPRAPVFWVEPLEEAAGVRWNGFRSETGTDNIWHERDFEGYRVYLSASGESGSYVCLGSCDVDDFWRFHWDSQLSDWQRDSHRFMLEETRLRYAPGGAEDHTWHPLDFSRSSPYTMEGCPDSVFYFVPVMANASQFGLETPFLKRYPAARCPGYDHPAEVPPDSADLYLTDDRYFKFYEYDFVIENLLPRESYWVVVTAFDYGSPMAAAASMESDLESRAVRVEPLYGPGCCQGTVGNVDCDDSDEVTLADVAALIDYLYISGTPPCCWSEADATASALGPAGESDISLADVAMLIDHLFISLRDLPDCP